MDQPQHNLSLATKSEKQWNCIYFTGAVATLVALAGILLDVIAGNITGGNLAALPQTAVDRFAQFHQNKFLGLYNLDLLNIIVQMIFIPGYFALYAAHRRVNNPFAMLAFIIFMFGTVIMVANNTALPMLGLSHKYFASSLESQRTLYAAAGEALLARGAHGSPGIFLGFFIPNLAGFILSVVMLEGKIFSRINSWLGIIGSLLMMLYVILVNFVPGIGTMATACAMPGGLMLMAWMILFTLKLFRLSKEETNL